MKRFIEVSFPIQEVSEMSVKEKTIRHGHISTLHIWWARRPLAASRATAYAALIPAPENDQEWDKIRQFVIELSKWENSLNPNIIENRRKDILDANGGIPLKVLDPFAGGGSIPLEALRLGCETYASDYNPVAVLILKAILEYPHKYGRSKETKEWGPLKESDSKNLLLEDVMKWGDKVLEEVRKEIVKFYPEEKDGSIPVGYIWARTIPCQNPSCSAEIPLMRQFWLANKSNKKIALKPSIVNNKVEFKISKNPDFDPSKGTIRRAVAKCIVCSSTVDANTTRKLFKKNKSSEKMIAVILSHAKKKGKTYRIATEEDIKIFEKSVKHLETKRKNLMEEWGIDPVPDEDTPEGKGRGAERAFSVRNYGLNTWGDLFNSRQMLSLITFVENIRKAYNRMLEEGYEENYGKVLTTYLALAIDRLADHNSSLQQHQPNKESFKNTFSRQALPMVWDYAEINPLLSEGGWPSSFVWLKYFLTKFLRSTKTNASLPEVFQSSATSLPYQDSYFDAVFTDPPYYDNVPYSDLSDFFYVWLKRTLGSLYPDLFMTPLTPKSKEIIAHSLRAGGWDEAKIFFEENLLKSFQEIHRVLKTNGIATIVYAHKSTSGWETLINAILDSGLVVTASWPIHTEMKRRLRAKESAALASSIYIICRKIEKKETGWFNEVKEEIQKYIYKKLKRLWEEGISGADYFIAAIGSSIEIFGKYEKVMDYEGNTIRADKLLDFIRNVVTNYAVSQILHNGIAEELSPLTKFYLLWRWTYQEAKVHFDEARKLAQSVGIDLAQEWDKGYIRKSKEFIIVLGPQDRELKELEESREFIDVLHNAMIFWKSGKREDMKEMLRDSGWGDKDTFYRVAQAISETLSIESKEKKLLDGFLSGKEKLIGEIKDKMIQKRLFE